VRDGHKRFAGTVAAVCVTALGGSMLAATPTYANPSIKDVKARVDSLYHQAEKASERYNAARGDLHADPNTFLDQLTTVSEYNDQQSQMMADFAVQVKQLQMRKQASKRQLVQISATEKKLAADKAQIDKKASAAKALLSHLREKARRAAAASRAATPTRVPMTSAPASGRAASAVQFAMAQVGEAYVYGAAGPSAWDCSGLTMMAWGAAGVSLPHSASAQMGYGTPVSSSQLQPGDLVFYYSPVSHVGMYIGNGMIVNAENPSAGVKIAPVFSMPFSGAVRPG
jgi:cell wall-associated NlpC family hydrolase